MIQAMVGKKLGMTQVFDESGVVYPATVIECGPNVVTQIKTEGQALEGEHRGLWAPGGIRYAYVIHTYKR